MGVLTPLRGLGYPLARARQARAIVPMQLPMFAVAGHFSLEPLVCASAPVQNKLRSSHSRYLPRTRPGEPLTPFNASIVLDDEGRHRFGDGVETDSQP